MKNIKIDTKLNDFPLQQIFYGAPGTGKSHEIKVESTNFAEVFRTTFHPDSDYSTFVGAYKPVVIDHKEWTVQTNNNTSYADEVKESSTSQNAKVEKKISYEYIPQAFMNAYLKAWELMIEASNDEQKEAKCVLLDIEEINRGNCAQIFGDIFQLLDRNDDGYSEYKIIPDRDIQNYVKEHFAETTLSEELLNKVVSDGAKLGDIVDGKYLVLPKNLFIWATMNTSDQSLFPMDSAFKRRWDWVYVPIETKKEEWTINVGNGYPWSTFLEKINEKILDTTQSEDKQLGFYFCRPEKDTLDISAEKFVGKVLFYLWNDVFKDYGFEDDLFDTGEKKSNGETKYFAFHDFYSGFKKINEDNVDKFLYNLLGSNNMNTSGDVSQNNNGGGTPANSKNNTKYSVNPDSQVGKNKLPITIVEKYKELHRNATADDILDVFGNQRSVIGHAIESSTEYNARTDNYKDRSKAVKCAEDTTVYVRINGYSGTGSVQPWIERAAELGIPIRVIENDTLNNENPL